MSADKNYFGTVIFFDNKAGYGFIEWGIDGKPQQDMFVHFSDIVCEGFKTVKKGQKVSFGIGLNNRGQPKAVNVTAIK